MTPIEILRTLVTAALAASLRWCIREWELLLLAIVPLAGAFSAAIEVNEHRLVGPSYAALVICAGFFLLVRLVPYADREAVAALRSIGHGCASVGWALHRILRSSAGDHEG